MERERPSDPATDPLRRAGGRLAAAAKQIVNLAGGGLHLVDSDHEGERRGYGTVGGGGRRHSGRRRTDVGNPTRCIAYRWVRNPLEKGLSADMATTRTEDSFSLGIP